MRRNNDDALEEMLRRAANQQGQQGQQDDVTIYSIERDDVETPIVQRRREIRFIQDPDGGEIPITVSHISYRMDDNGKPLSNINQAGECKYGCIVQNSSLFVCRCGSLICRRHSIRIGSRTYCRGSICGIIGMLRQIFRFINKVIRFFAVSIFGFDSKTDESAVRSEEEFFNPPPENPNIDGRR